MDLTYTVAVLLVYDLEKFQFIVQVVLVVQISDPVHEGGY
jgi:hypothetical protein